MQILSNILAFLFVAGVVIFVHELGHFLAGRALGVRVRTFSLGFGKKIWGFRRDGTDYRVAAIPLGGYVSFAGSDPSVQTDDPGAFVNHPRWQRIVIYLAGPAMNVVLSVTLVAFIFMVGIDLPNTRDVSTEVGTVLEDSAGAEAGLREGDLIRSIDGEEVEDWQAVSMAVLTSPEREMAVEVERGGDRLQLALTPREIPREELGDAGIYPAAPVRVYRLVEDSPAERAGLRFGDALISVDGRPVASPQSFQDLVGPRAGEEVLLELEREGQPLSVRVIPEDQDGRGIVGVIIAEFHFQRFGPLEAFAQSARYNWDITVQISEFVGKLFERRISAKSTLGGPIQIATYSGKAARRSFKDLVFFMALLSLNLCIFNMLPLPILDGGQILILLVESTLRRDLSLQVKERMIQVGLVAIVALMALALYFDLSKALPVVVGSP
ncbi:MAG: RIP metalloprotease RseP [Acidobacteriota bacterium]